MHTVHCAKPNRGWSKRLQYKVCPKVKQCIAMGRVDAIQYPVPCRPGHKSKNACNQIYVRSLKRICVVYAYNRVSGHKKQALLQ